MRKAPKTKVIALIFAAGIGVGVLTSAGCQSNSSAANDPEMRTRPSVDQEMGGGMNKTGSGADNGASSSGMDRAGGGTSGTHGDNSGGAKTPTVSPTVGQ